MSAPVSTMELAFGPKTSHNDRNYHLKIDRRHQQSFILASILVSTYATCPHCTLQG
jgi:hypothetical protein